MIIRLESVVIDIFREFCYQFHATKTRNIWGQIFDLDNPVDGKDLTPVS